MTYSIAPTDLTFLYEECKTCFWHKIHGSKRPYMPFPSIFNKIDKSMRGAIHMMDLEELTGEDRGYTLIDAEERRLKTPIMSSKTCNYIINARPDGVVYTSEDKSTGIIFDMKTGTPKDEHIEMYRRQLCLGAIACKHPAPPKTKKAKVYNPINIERGALLYATPDTCAPNRHEREWDSRTTALNMSLGLTWIEFDLELDKFLAWMDEDVWPFITGPEPNPNDDCVFCSHREYHRQF